MNEIHVTMPCDVCGWNFTTQFDPTDGKWKGFNPFDDPDVVCRCKQRAAKAFDISDVDASYARIVAISDRQAQQVREMLADTMRIAFARSVPAGQMELEAG